MKPQFLLFFLLSSFLKQTPLPAQDISGLESISSFIGLSNSNIQTFQQDENGFFWIGTAQGLNRYDGYTYVHYNDSPTNPNNIPASYVHKVVPLNNRQLMIHAKQEAFILHTSSNVITPILPNSSSHLEHKVNDFIQGKDSSIYFLTYKKSTRYLTKWRPDGTTILVDSIPTTRERWAVIDIGKDGTLWWAEPDGRIRVYDDKMKLLKAFDAFPVEKFNIRGSLISIVVDNHREGIWIMEYEKKERTKFLFYHLPSNKLQTISLPTPHHAEYGIQDVEGNIWFYHSYDFGFFKLSPDNEIVDFTDALQSVCNYKNIKTVYEDKNGLIWIGANSCILKLPNKKSPFQKLFTSPEIPFNSVFEFQQNIYGQSIASKYLFQFAPKTGTEKTILLKDSKGNPVHRNIAAKTLVLHDESAWGVIDPSGTPYKGGITKIDLKTYTMEIDSSVYPDLILNYHVSISPYDDELMFTFRPLNIFKYYTKSKRVEKLIPTKETNPFYAQSLHLLEDKNKNVWMGTFRNGLLKIKPHEGIIKQYTSKSSPYISNDYVNHMYLEPDEKTLWAATYYGLNKINLEQETVDVFTTADGLSANLIYNILPYGADYLVLGTNYGLSIFNKKTKTFFNFFEEDGLSSNHFILSTPMISEAGKYYFPTQKGITAFYPADLLEQEVNYPLQLTKFSGYDSKTEKTFHRTNELIDNHTFTIAPTVEYFQFDFALTSYFFPKRNQYRCRMLGTETNWRFLGSEPNARYNKLSPGTYTLQIEGADANGNWGSKPLELTIIVQPFWYKTKIAYLAYFLLTVGLLYTIFRFQLKRSQLQNQLAFEQKEAERLSELDKIKTNFFSNITHEFRTPLTLILEPVRQILQEEEDGKFSQKLHLVKNNSEKLLMLVNQLLDISKLESGKMGLDLRKGNLINVLQPVFESFQILAEKKGLEFHISSTNDLQEFYFDKFQVEKIFYNLLSNAIKFTQQGFVKVIFEKQNSHTLVIKIMDTGHGIPADQVEHIFKRFYQVDDSSTRQGEGTGIGLALTKELVELMQGTIDVKSEEKKGTTFTVTLSTNLQPEKELAPLPHLIENHIELESFILSKKKLLEKEENKPSKIDEDADLILLIEDNVELRQFIKQSLPASYHVIEAAEGEAGILLAKEQIPDLIISDLMMPKKDGFEVLQELKSEVKTSHIPIILLTAKSAIKSKIEGLQRGADAYLTKPFNTEELLVRISKLIELRRNLQKKFSQKLTELTVIQPSEILSKVDIDFLENVKILLQQNVDNDQLTVELLAEKVFMSRSQLFRKLKALTNLSPNEFIRNYRLDRAMELLQTERDSIRQTAFQVGFSNEKYFSKKFKERFGKLPSEI